MKQFRIILALALLALVPALRVGAVTNTWITAGPSTNDWSNTNNWSTTNIPANGDDVIITNINVGVLLTNSTAELSSILLSNKCTLIFSNWNTSLSATNVTILSGGAITLPAAFSNSWMSNRVWIVCSDLALWGGANINADGRGYRSGNGPGRPTYDDNNSAGSYGGRGGGPYGGNRYGAVEAPLDPGSGGRTNNTAAQGGGAVRIDAAGTVMINGTISANGNDASGSLTGGSSGGGIYINCYTLTGTGGIVRANGGSHGGSSGAGGGGRIAVVYNSAAQSNETNTITFSVSPGSGSYVGDIGTLYFPDNQFLSTVVRHSGKWLVAGFTNWAVPALTISNASIGFPGDNFLLNIAGDLTITGSSARLWLGSNVLSSYTPYSSVATNGPTLRVGGNLIVTNSAQLHIFSGNTNDAVPYGAQVIVTGDVFIASGSAIYLYSQHANTNSGASPLLTARNVIVASGGAIYASGLGYPSRTGPGKGSTYDAGAGYGGKGGYPGGGPTYGSSNVPALPGSGGGVGQPSTFPNMARGGGLVRIEAQSVRVDGSINVNGYPGYGNLMGGASGGGIFIICNRIEGGGTLSANGGAEGSSSRGGGGGGRIAVWFDARNIGWLTQKLRENPNYIPKQVASLPFFTGTVSVAGGSASYPGTNGTIMYIQAPAPGTIFTMH